MGLQQRRQYETYLRTGRRSLVVDNDGTATEVKFNPHHDPDNGQFTFGPGGGAASGDEIVVTARRPHPAPASQAAPPAKGPFKRRPNEVGIDGEVADALNKLIEDPHASVRLTLAGAPVTISRTGPDAARVTGHTPLGEFHMDGKFHVGPGQEAVTVTNLDPNASTSHVPAPASLASFPRNIRIARDSKKRMTYNIDKPVVTKVFGATVNRQEAGTYYFRH